MYIYYIHVYVIKKCMIFMCIYDIYTVYVFIGVYIYWYIYLYMHITIYWFIKTFYLPNHHHTQQLAQPLRHKIRSNRPKCTKAVNIYIYIYISVCVCRFIHVYIYIYKKYSQEKNNNIFRK